jgi:hypothetical protein
MTTRANGRAALKLTPEPAGSPQPSVAFCSHCGAHPEADVQSRVCDACGLGLILYADAESAPQRGDAFVVLDGSLAVCAVSEAAESLLASRETDAVNRHVTELVVPADAEAQEGQNLAVAVTWAVRGDDAAREVTVRPANTFGVRLKARISSCGPPRAALIAFD